MSYSRRYLISGPTNRGNDGCAVLTPLFSSSVYSTILTLNTYFMDGNLAYLDEHLTFNHYESLSAQLYSLRNPSSTIYESVRALLVTLLQHLYQSTQWHNDTMEQH